MDFVTDSFLNDRRLRLLTIVDDHSLESVAIELEFSPTSERVTRGLYWLATICALPAVITVDNDPEFAG